MDQRQKLNGQTDDMRTSEGTTGWQFRKRCWPLMRHWKICGLVLMLALSVSGSTDLKIDRLLVLKRKHQLLLLSGNQIVKTYAVALGIGGLRPKRREGDHRTPEGRYLIDARNPASRFHLGLHISYPNQADKVRARKRGVRPGGDIMIHGLGEEFSSLGVKQHLYDWTEGCIAVTDAEIEEIWRLVPTGTPIEIRP
jgi:murein L,D-transpeptidase YafK